MSRGFFVAVCRCEIIQILPATIGHSDKKVKLQFTKY